MIAPTLKEALRLVETLGLAPLTRVGNTQPKNYVGHTYSRWNERRLEVEREVAARLDEHGATFTLRFDGYRIRFAGVSASSAMGLGQALRNWKAGAEKRLRQGGKRS